MPKSKQLKRGLKPGKRSLKGTTAKKDSKSALKLNEAGRKAVKPRVVKQHLISAKQASASLRLCDCLA